MPIKDPEKRKQAAKAWNRTWYENNKAQRAAINLRRKQEIRAQLWKLKEEGECSKCGESHPATLHFHHRDPSTKLFDLAGAAARQYSPAKIEAEVAKCDLLCANCHAIHHWIGSSKAERQTLNLRR